MSNFKTGLIELLKADRPLCESLMDAHSGSVLQYRNGVLKSFCDSAEVVDSYGGTEKGSTYYSVVKFDLNGGEGEITIKFDGYYASYSGADFERFTIVEGTPVQKIEWTPVDYSETYTASSY